MDLYELRTGFKDWSRVMPIPEICSWVHGQILLDLETDRLIDSWKFEEWKDETEEKIVEDLGQEMRDECFETAFDNGFNNGKTEGLDEGRTEGYKEGYADARKYYEGLRP